MKHFFVLFIALFTPLRAMSDSQDQIEARVDTILSQMTLEEKIDYIGGHNAFFIRSIDRLGIPELKMADGPMGVRNWGPSTAYPATICLAASWDTDLAYRVGAMMGIDSRARGVHFLLAPGMNIHRFPLCGRNFEYLGEDPYLASRFAVNLIHGIQSQGVVATAKHFAVYNQEYNRHQISSNLDERTLREIYLPTFEACVKEAKVGALMNSYNLINGIHASQHDYLNNQIAKKEWGFDGIIMSDWTSTYDGVAAANGGLDLEMPYGAYMNRGALLPAIKKGVVAQEVIDDKVRRILRVAIRFGLFEQKPHDTAFSQYNQEGRKVALEAAEGGIVLLKNSGLLPLKKSALSTLAIIGPRACQPIPRGGGSSIVTPMVSSSFLQAIADMAGKKTKILYSRGVPDLQNAFDWSQFSTTKEATTPGLFAEYFDNPTLSGKPALVRVDEQVNFSWKERSYKAGGPVNHYSVRWTGYFKAAATSEHTLYISANDGFKLLIDDAPAIDRWDGLGESLQYKTMLLEAGKSYKICLEYYVNHGSQAIQFGIATGANHALNEAKAVAEAADAVIVCVGFDAANEGEDWDRSFQLPEGQEELVREILKVNSNVVVVMTAGSNVSMYPWIDETNALLWAWYPGQEGGEALAKILFGKTCPSGKLPISFERHLQDNPAYKNYHTALNSQQITYAEGLFVGYRHFDQAAKKPLFAFGHGLSYTTFAYSNLAIAKESTNVKVTFDISNTGSQAGAEVAQIYVSEKAPKVTRPLKELKAFKKVFLEPQQTKRVSVLLEPRAFAYYDVATKAWKNESGPFELLIGSASDKIECGESLSFP